MVQYSLLALRHFIGKLSVRDLLAEFPKDESLDIRRLGDAGIKSVELGEYFRVKDWSCQFVVMVVEATCEAVVLSIILSELECEWAVGRSLAIPLRTLIGRLALLTAIAVENIDAVAVWIVSFSSLRDKLDVHWSENVVNSLSYGSHVFEGLVLKVAYIDVHLQVIFVLTLDGCLNA